MEYDELKKLIVEDNVGELANILNSNENHNFNILHSRTQTPLLHVAVQEQSQKVLEYLLSQPFVYKNVCNSSGENIYHVICSIRGAEQLFSTVEKYMPQHLLLNKSHYGMTAFHIACYENNIFIVKRVYEILESLKVNLFPITNSVMEFALTNKDIEVIKYVSSIDGIQLEDKILFNAILVPMFDIVVYLLNVYLCQSIPSHLHNQFHIFQFVNHSPYNDKEYKNGILINDNNYNEEFNPKKKKRGRCDNGDAFKLINKKRKLFHSERNNNNNHLNDFLDDDDYSYLIEENFKRIMEVTRNGNRIWHCVCKNANLDVVQLIFSLKGIQPEILNKDGHIEGKNVFLIACKYNSNIKVIKYIHKLFPLFIHSQTNRKKAVQNGVYFIMDSRHLKCLDKLNILHYLYLNGIDIHLLTLNNHRHPRYKSIYSSIVAENIVQYLKVISQDFDYLQNEHDDEAYRKPSFWKEIDHNNGDEQSIRINEWKNRFDEHVLHHLSKMIQEHMLKPNQQL